MFLQCLQLPEDQLQQRDVDFVDIAYDVVPPKHYKEEEVKISYSTVIIMQYNLKELAFSSKQ